MSLSLSYSGTALPGLQIYIYLFIYLFIYDEDSRLSGRAYNTVHGVSRHLRGTLGGPVHPTETPYHPSTLKNGRLTSDYYNGMAACKAVFCFPRAREVRESLGHEAKNNGKLTDW